MTIVVSGRPEVSAQRGLVAGVMEMDGILHIIPGRIFRELTYR